MLSSIASYGFSRSRQYSTSNEPCTEPRSFVEDTMGCDGNVYMTIRRRLYTREDFEGKYLLPPEESWTCWGHFRYCCSRLKRKLE
jgi:hypothetical protein